MSGYYLYSKLWRSGVSAHIGTGGTESTGYTATLTDGLTFTSDNTSIATVSPAGVVTAGNTSGTAHISVSAVVGVNTVLTAATPAAIVVTVPSAKLTSIALAPLAVSLLPGDTKQLTVTGTYSDGTTAELPASGEIFTSSNTAVATVSAAGIVTALSTATEGQTATISATDTASGLTTSAASSTVVTVSMSAPTLSSIALSPLSATIAPGGTQQLTVTGTYSNSTTAVLAASGEGFTSMNPGVASVNSAGLVTVSSSATTGATATIVATDTASGLTTSNANSTVITVGAAASSAGILSTGFNSNGTTTTPTSATGMYFTYAGGANNPAGGSGGQYADKGVNPSSEYQYVNDTAANLGGYVYEGIGIAAATGQTVSTSGFNSLSFTLNVNAEWLAAGTPKFVILIASNISGVSNANCNPSVAAVVMATSSSPTTYTVPLTAFTKVAQNCGVGSVTAAQVLAAPIARIDFQADGEGSAITASGLTSNINTSVPASGSSPATYPTTINITGTVGFVSATPPQATLVSIALSPLNASLAPGATQQLSVTGTYSDSTTAVLSSGETFASSNTAVATVSAGGLVTVAAGATPGQTATITATDTASGLSTSVANSTVITATAPATSGTGVLSTGFNSNGTTTTSTTATGMYFTYAGGANNPAGGSGGQYADKGVNPSNEYQYVNDTAANLGGYVYEGVGIAAATGQTVSTTGFNSLSFTLNVNAEWLSAGTPNFVILIAGNVSGVSNANCNPSVAAVVTATSASPTAYTVPLTAFTTVTQNCGVGSVTAAQILAAPIARIDFQADGAASAITASGLTSNINTSVAAAGSSPATYPTTINITGTVAFVTASSPPPATTPVLSTGFNSNGTTTSSTAATGMYFTYAGGANNPAGGSGGQYADKGVNPSNEYQYVNDTAANLGGYVYEGIGIAAATGQTVSSSGFSSLGFTLNVNSEWLAAGTPNFVILIAGNVSGVSNANCNPSVAAVVTATASSPAAYKVPLTAFTTVTQNCGVGSVTAAQILAAPTARIDFQADGAASAITASGLTSNINTSVAAAGSSPATYPTTVNITGTVGFTN